VIVLFYFLFTVNVPFVVLRGCPCNRCECRPTHAILGRLPYQDQPRSTCQQKFGNEIISLVIFLFYVLRFHSLAMLSTFTQWTHRETTHLWREAVMSAEPHIRPSCSIFLLSRRTYVSATDTTTIRILEVALTYFVICVDVGL
jgi:hypothetical protein